MKKAIENSPLTRFEDFVQDFEVARGISFQEHITDIQISQLRRILAEQQTRQVFAHEAARVLKIAKKSHRKDDGLFCELVNALSLMLEQRPPESGELEHEGEAARGWEEAFDVAQELVQIKIDELPPLDSHTPAITKALNQVWAAFSKAESSFETYGLPETLNRYKRRPIPRTGPRPREMLTMPKAILAAVPTAGAVALRKDVERMLLEKKLTHSRGSASKEIKKLIVKGVLVEHRQPGGRLIERATPKS